MSPLHPLYWFELFKRYPIAVTQGFFAVILAASNWFIFLNHAEIESELEGVAKSGKEVLTNVSNSPVIRQQAVSIRAALGYLDANLLVETNMPENVGYFYGLEDTTKIKIADLQQLSSPTPPEGAPYRAIPFTFRSSGDFGQLLQLTHTIENGRYPAKLARFEFSRREDDPGQLQATFSVVLLGKL